MPRARTKRKRPGLRTGHSSARFKRRVFKVNIAKSGWRPRVRDVQGSTIARLQTEKQQEKVEQNLEIVDARGSHLPRWGAALVALPLLGILAWAVDGVAVPDLAELVRSAPVLGAALVALLGVTTFGLDATEVAKPTRRVELRYHRTAQWLPGETTAERDARVRTDELAAPVTCYPGGVPGRVIDVRDIDEVASGRLPSLLEMASRATPVIVIDVTEAQLTRLRNREDRVDASGTLERTVPMSLDDRHGAILPDLVAKYGSRRAVEVAEQTAAFEEKEAELAPDAPHTFDLDVTRLRKALPPTVTNTGTGLYFTKVTPASISTTVAAIVGQKVTLTSGGMGTADEYKGGYFSNTTRSESRAVVTHDDDDDGTLEGSLAAWQVGDSVTAYDAWSSVQGACDQLWTDQGASTFTASQYVRVFAGTYDENVLPDGSLVPDMTTGYPLFLEGDPAADRDDIHIAPTSGSYALQASQDLVVVQHMRVGQSETLAAIQQYSNGNSLSIIDCHLTPGTHGVYGYSDTRIKDTTITLDSGGARTGIVSNYTLRGLVVENCIITGAGGGSHTAIAARGQVRVEGTRISGCATGVVVSVWPASAVAVTNCTIYGATEAVKLSMYVGRLHVLNTIFAACTYPLSFPKGWPEESATQLGADLTLRNNNAYDFTAFAKGPSGETKTYEQFIALNQVDAAGDIFTDPLLTDPAAGDFSLQAASPCRNAGHGSGVVTGINGVAFDKHPDIGAWSSGTLTVAAPTLNTAADQVDGDSVVVDVTAANAQDSIYVYYKKSSDSAWTQWPTPRTGSGTVTVSGLTDGSLYLFEARPFRFIWGESSTVLTATVTSSGLSASGAVSLPLENVRTLLANSAAFQTLVSAIDASAAKASIHYPAKIAPWTRPRAVLNHLSPSPRHVLVSRGKGNGFAEEGEAEIIIEADIGAGYKTDGQVENAFLEFGNVIGAIMTEMGALAGTSTYLDAQEFESDVERSDQDEEAVDTYFYRGVITVRWGGS